MNCEIARDRMLEADPVELRGQTDTELARHLAECERCAAVAGALLVELERLDDGLEAWAGSADPDAAVDAVLAGARADRSRAGREARAIRRPGGPAPRWARHAWIPLAAAAAITGVVLLAPEPDPGAVGRTFRIEPVVSVRPPADRGAVVMQTPNPNITIVWLYEREET